MDAFLMIHTSITRQQPKVAELGFAAYLLCEVRCLSCRERFNASLTKSDRCSLCDLRREVAEHDMPNVQ